MAARERLATAQRRGATMAIRPAFTPRVAYFDERSRAEIEGTRRRWRRERDGAGAMEPDLEVRHAQHPGDERQHQLAAAIGGGDDAAVVDLGRAAGRLDQLPALGQRHRAVVDAGAAHLEVDPQVEAVLVDAQAQQLVDLGMELGRGAPQALMDGQRLAVEGHRGCRLGPAQRAGIDAAQPRILGERDADGVDAIVDDAERADGAAGAVERRQRDGDRSLGSGCERRDRLLDLDGQLAVAFDRPAELERQPSASHRPGGEIRAAHRDDLLALAEGEGEAGERMPFDMDLDALEQIDGMGGDGLARVQLADHQRFACARHRRLPGQRQGSERTERDARAGRRRQLLGGHRRRGLRGEGGGALAEVEHELASRRAQERQSDMAPAIGFPLHGRSQGGGDLVGPGARHVEHEAACGARQAHPRIARAEGHQVEAIRQGQRAPAVADRGHGRGQRQQRALAGDRALERIAGDRGQRRRRGPRGGEGEPEVGRGGVRHHHAALQQRRARLGVRQVDDGRQRRRGLGRHHRRLRVGGRRARRLVCRDQQGCGSSRERDGDAPNGAGEAAAGAD